ncbi:DUF5994 family protein [Kitasatospora sp. NPDC057223]|uniref:DUF5994 family protein n=1 Tax=Kitasatospora sp. NPDC057223 TaxID=3346055 RepID=UPI003637A725
MADDSGTPFPVLRPDRFRETAKPGSVLFSPATTRSREGTLDGAGWPRSRDVGAEPPGLVPALTGHLGPVTSIGLNTGAWDDVPAPLVDGRSVHIGWYPVGGDTVIITRVTAIVSGCSSSLRKQASTRPVPPWRGRSRPAVWRAPTRRGGSPSPPASAPAFRRIVLTDAPPVRVVRAAGSRVETCPST